ncbi:MAG: hypothetical protein AAF467_16905 [Actinomycetota bacterium]
MGGGLTLVAAAVFGAVVVVAAIILGVRGYDAVAERLEAAAEADDEPAQPDADAEQAPDTQPPQSVPPSTTPPSTEPEAEPEPDIDVETAPCPAGTDPVVCEAAEFVQQVRGRPFQTFPAVEFLPDEQFDSELLTDFDSYRAELDVDGDLLRALGLLDADQSLSALLRDAFEVAVVGFYDPETERLVVRGESLNLYEQSVLVHELVHAFDDQWFDLDRDDFADDDAEYGFVAVVEGNARRVEALWMETLTPDEAAQFTAEELGALSPEDISRLIALPSIVLDLQASPYTDGNRYVEDLAAVGGEAGVDAALEAPPTSSEEILHPGTDRQLDPERDVPAPPATGEVIEEGRLGELMIRSWLGRVAGDGWGGDRYQLTRAGGQVCVVVDVIGDTPADNTDVATAAQVWTLQAPDARTVETIQSEFGDLVRISGCVTS